MSSRLLFIVPAALFAVVFVLGCGSDDTAPKQSLSEIEKQQIKELNQQRQEEWGPRKK